MEEKDLKELDKKFIDWLKKLETDECEEIKIIAEATIIQTMLLYNIDKNISIIRGMIKDMMIENKYEL